MLTGGGICEGPRKVNLLHLVPSIIDSAFTISERLFHHLAYSFFTHSFGITPHFIASIGPSLI